MKIEAALTPLAARLAKPSYSKLVKPKDHFPGSGVGEFYTFLNQWVYQLTDDEIANSLSDYLPPETLPGLAMRFRVQISKIAG